MLLRLLPKLAVTPCILAALMLSGPVLAAAVPLFPGAFTKYEGNPVLDVGDAGSWDAVEVFTPSVLRDGSTYHMWYTGGDASHATRIGHATSPDGLAWVKDATNPVLSPGAGWDSGGTRFPTVILDGGTFRMWYASVNPTEIGYATSTDSSTWQRYPSAVLRRGEAGTWDSSWVGFPAVVKVGAIYHMWYIGRDAGILSSALGHATSSDGVTWTKDPENPVFRGVQRDWEDGGLEAASVTYDGSVFHLWYSAGPGEIGQAVSTDGVQWVRRARVLARGADRTYDALGADYAHVVAASEGYLMWYSALDKDDESGRYRIAFASSGYGPIVHLPMQQMGYRERKLE